MKKSLLISACLLIHAACFAGTPKTTACAMALPIDNPSFCSSFQTSATCNCEEKAPWPPSFYCATMDRIYNAMKLRYGSLENACANQTKTPQQMCIDDWNCYRNGGRDSRGLLCSGSGRAC